MASLIVTYLLWLFGGVLGLHHLYLGRLHHAIVWTTTLGGVFGLGWMRELWRLPDYVRCSNADTEYQNRQRYRIGLNPVPNCGMARFCGMFLTGYCITTTLCGLLPKDFTDSMSGYTLYRICLIVFIMVGSSFGVYLVANIGEMQCSWKYPVVGSVLALPWLILSPNSINSAVAIPTLVTWWYGLRWKPVQPLSKNRGSKCFVYALVIVLWTVVLGYGLYYNTTISVNGQEGIPLREAVSQFFASSVWQRLKESLQRLYQALEEGDWEHFQMTDIVDISGEVKALSVIGLSRNASKEEVTKKCRKLSAQFHPDRFKTELEKEVAESKFIEIQDACTVLGGRQLRSRSMND